MAQCSVRRHALLLVALLCGAAAASAAQPAQPRPTKEQPAAAQQPVAQPAAKEQGYYPAGGKPDKHKSKPDKEDDWEEEEEEDEYKPVKEPEPEPEHVIADSYTLHAVGCTTKFPGVAFSSPANPDTSTVTGSVLVACNPSNMPGSEPVGTCIYSGITDDEIVWSYNTSATQGWMAHVYLTCTLDKAKMVRVGRHHGEPCPAELMALSNKPHNHHVSGTTKIAAQGRVGINYNSVNHDFIVKSEDALHGPEQVDGMGRLIVTGFHNGQAEGPGAQLRQYLPLARFNVGTASLTFNQCTSMNPNNTALASSTSSVPGIKPQFGQGNGFITFDLTI